MKIPLQKFSNTQLRIGSGLVLFILVIGCLLAGPEFSHGIFGIAGIGVLDEIWVNIFKRSRKRTSYFSCLLIYVFGYWFIPVIFIGPGYFLVMSLVGSLVNLLFLGFLFENSKWIDKIWVSLRAFGWPIVFIVLGWMVSISTLFFHPDWERWVGALFVLNFAVDTGAWLAGKTFGRHKLIERISPKKTVEGAIGGVVFSILLSWQYWTYFEMPITPPTWALFFFLSISSQLGDLIQSAIKRRAMIKDSSQLIPGHGGLYDRLDSLIFTGPLFVLAFGIWNV